MKTILSHIIQKRFSMENEDVATEGLAFITQSSEAARSGLMNVLRGILPDLPSLRFQTQQTVDGLRPDMSGLDGRNLRVFIENKFWAGLTDNQPLEYLKILAKHDKATILLVVVPTARQETIWRELIRRTEESNISTVNRSSSSDIPYVVETGIGPHLALTSWTKLLSAIDSEIADDPQIRNDLLQLRALCDAADTDAFIPLSTLELTDQRLPNLVLQVNSLVQGVVNQGITEGILSTEGLRPMSSWDRIGRYLSFPSARNVGAWLGIDFNLWRQHGGTPLWLMFSQTDWGRALDVKDIIESWAEHKGIFTTMKEDQFAIGIDLPTGLELDEVKRVVVNRLKDISVQLSELKEA